MGYNLECPGDTRVRLGAGVDWFKDLELVKIEKSTRHDRGVEQNSPFSCSDDAKHNRCGKILIRKNIITVTQRPTNNQTSDWTSSNETPSPVKMYKQRSGCLLSILKIYYKYLFVYARLRMPGLKHTRVLYGEIVFCMRGGERLFVYSKIFWNTSCLRNYGELHRITVVSRTG